MPKTSPIVLMAADAEDLQTISAMLQDAIVKVGDIAFLKEERRFAFVANRFMWEAKRGLFSQGQRVRAGVHFDDVQTVRARAVKMTNKEALLDILSLEWDGSEDGGTITINLAGGGLIALDVGAINVTVKDISEPWRARRKPDHEVG